MAQISERDAVEKEDAELVQFMRAEVTDYAATAEGKKFFAKYPAALAESFGEVARLERQLKDEREHPEKASSLERQSRLTGISVANL